MVFGFFARTATLDTSERDQHTRLPTPTPSVASAAHHSPFRFHTILPSVLGGSTTDLTLKDSDQATDSVAEAASPACFAPPPPVTPSPPPGPEPNDTQILYDLVLTIPPKTLHTYTLAHLRPPTHLSSTTVSSPALGSHADNTPRPLSPDTVTKLAAFFSALEPPPLLHCVRCHKDFYNVENDERDKACRVPHDDESALVSRVSGASGGGYETLWGCCGQTASGDGSEGPPDGWCYEGRHTTDIRRARFRADSTMHNDKLTSCVKLNCRGVRGQLPQRDSCASPSRNVGASSVRGSNPSPTRSQTSTAIPRSSRKRPRRSLKESGSENEADLESLVGRAAKAKEKESIGGGEGEGTNTAVDEPSPSSKPKSRAKPRSQPISQARRAPSTPAMCPSPKLAPSLTPAGSTRARTMATKPKSTSHTLVSQTRTHTASDSEASTRSHPRTRSRVREESRGRTAPKLTRANLQERAGRARKSAKQQATTSEEEREAETGKDQASDGEVRGRDRKKRRLRV